MSTINERINLLIEHFSKGNKSAFAREIGVNATVIENVVGSRGGKPSFDVLEKIIHAYANVCSEWLLIGTGDMLKSAVFNDSKIDPQSESILLKLLNERDKKIDQLNREIGRLENELKQTWHNSEKPLRHVAESEIKYKKNEKLE